MSNTSLNKKRLGIIIPIASFLIMIGGVIIFASGYLFAKHEISQDINPGSQAAIASSSESALYEEVETDHTSYESIDIDAGINKSVSLDWSRDIPKEYAITFDVNESDDTCTIILPADKAFDITYSYYYHTASYGSLFSIDAINTPDTITGFKACDVNFDGYTDIIFTGTKDREEMSWLFVGDAAFYDPIDAYEGTSFVAYPAITDATQYLNKGFSADDVSDYYSNGQINGEFESYKEGYKAIIGFYETLSARTNRYDLIKIDDDDIPELLMATGERGNNFSVCTFKDGYVYQFMNWHHQKDSYEYVPQKNIILQNNSTESYIYGLKDCKLAIGYVEDLSNYGSNPFKKAVSFSDGKEAKDFIKEQLD